MTSQFFIIFTAVWKNVMPICYRDYNGIIKKLEKAKSTQ